MKNKMKPIMIIGLIIFFIFILIMIFISPSIFYLFDKLPYQKLVSKTNKTEDSLFLFTGKYVIQPLEERNNKFYLVMANDISIEIEIEKEKSTLKHPYYFEIKYPFQIVKLRFIYKNKSSSNGELAYSLHRIL